MKKAAETTTRTSSGKPEYTVVNLGLELLSTTWRIAVPALLFAGAGIALDLKFDTSPWITIVLTIVGFGVAAHLVKKQLAAVEREDTSQ